MKLYAVINMDIVNSRNIRNRIEIQDELKKLFTIIHNTYYESMVCPIRFTLGDEWQIVLKEPSISYDIYCIIRDYLLLKGIKAYCGIGIGTISTRISDISTEMDGEAFISGREALNISKEKVKNFSHKWSYSKEHRIIFKAKLYKEDLLAEVAVTSEDNYNLEEVINLLIANNEIIFSRVTEKQLKIINLYKETNSYNKLLDKNLVKSKSEISQKLTTSNYSLMEKNRECIRNLIKSYVISLGGN